MKNQNSPPSPSELRAQFDEARAVEASALNENGAGEILRCLSNSIATLQREGMDIGIAVRPGACADAYHLINAASGINTNGDSAVDAYGFINFSQSSALFAVATQHDGTHIERLYISEWNLSGEAVLGTPMVNTTYQNYSLPVIFFDFGEDENAFKDLQEYLVSKCATNAAVLATDEENVFNREAPVSAMNKPRPKLSL